MIGTALKTAVPAHEIGLGTYLMRNGHIASITAKLDIRVHDESGGEHIVPVWYGLCLQCEERRTWNLDGTFSATGAAHPFDIVGLP